MRKIGVYLCLLLFVLGALALRNHTDEKAFPESVLPLPVEKDSLKVFLGKILFYDPVLSADSSISCASCHSPYQAFAHSDHTRSHGISNQLTLRNAPPLFNLAWKKEFMRDGASNHLEVQALAPIEHPDEMGERFPRVVEKIKRQNFYEKWFLEAFGKKPDGAAILQALSAFELTLVSKQSLYDSVMAGNAVFQAQQQQGYHLFKKYCDRCHQEPLFTKNGFENNGLPPDSSLKDYGRMRVTGRKSDSLLFSIPSLRNLRYTAPYMHDGRMASLSAVLMHYRGFIGKKGPTPGDTLSAKDRKDLMAFLNTLNDPAFVFAPENKYPFKKIQQLRETINQPINENK